MAESSREQPKQNNILRHIRKEDPFQDDKGFLSEFESLHAKMLANPESGIEYSKILQEQIRSAKDHDSKFRLQWLGHELFQDDYYYKTQLAAALVERNEHLELAGRLLAQVAKEDPNERVIFDLAIIFKKQGKYNEALKFLQYIEDKFPDRDELKVLLARSDCFSRLGRHKDALSMIERVVTLEPDNLEFRHTKAQKELMLGQNDEALKTIDGVIAVNPLDVLAYNIKTHILTSAGRFAEALRVLNQTLALDPTNATTYGVKANTLHKLGRDNEALVEVENALTRSPNNPVLLGIKAQSLLALGKHDECASLIGSLGEETISKNEYLMWMQAKALGFEGDILHCKQRLLQLLNRSPKYNYAKAFVAMGGRADKPERNEIAVIQTLKGIFGEEKFRQIEQDAQTFTWGISSEDAEQELFSREVSNSFWSGLYEQAVDSNARTVVFHPQSMPKDNGQP